MRFAKRQTVTDESNGLSLSSAEVGKFYELLALAGGASFREKISSMGLNSGVRLRIIANSGHGPVGLEVRNTRLGVGRGMAEKIRVREIAPG
ncbi:MAG: FeoA domain-containing protein [candidate division Zixibacteria bacterium]|nr:FeoA domain-containing protein [candidate division Zixibacteria bacterium]